MDERWIGKLQLMETWLAFLTAVFTGISLFLVWKGYLLAKDYLGQHRDKVKEEKRIELIYETKIKLSEIRFLYDELYSIPFEVRKNIETFPNNYSKIIKDHMDVQLIKIKAEEYKLKRLKVEAITNLSLLKLDDLQKDAVEIFSGFEHLTFFHKSYLNKDTGELKPQLNIEFFNVIATEINSDNPFLIKARTKFMNLQKELSNLYWN